MVIKILFNIAGTLALVLAVLGLALPLLPATPFLLLASACYLRGSDRLHGWLVANKITGPWLASLRGGRPIPLRALIMALFFLWSSLAFSAWLVPNPWLRACLLIPGAAVTVYLLRARTATA